MPSVEIRDVVKIYEGARAPSAPALDHVSFKAESGEFLALLGPSGCGKSTLLRIIAGLEATDAGDVLIDGRRVNDVPAAQRRIAMVFQNYALYPHLDVQENILFGLKVRKVPQQEQRERLDHAVRMLGLRDYLQRKPAELSGGQRQRVALGRAVVSQAQLVLMDEPLSNLDAKLRQQMRAELRGLQRDLGLTVIYVTHDQVEAMTMADRVVVMRKGGIEQSAPPIDLYQRPATLTVAGFIGSPPMNLMPARYAQGAIRLAQPEPAVAFDAQLAEAGFAGDVLVGARPEQLHLGPGEITFRGVAKVVEYHGADTILGVDIGQPARLMARLPGLAQVRPGDDVQLGMAAAHLGIFSAASERRLERSA